MKIRTEKLAIRCEICHQSDNFDAINNYCSRCSSHDIKKLIGSMKKIRLSWVRLGFRYTGMILGGLLGVFAPCGTRYLFLDPMQVFIQRSFRMLLFSLIFMCLGSVIGTEIGESTRLFILFCKRYFVKLTSKK